jgi:hypothetical protein
MVIVKYVPTDATEILVLIRPTLKIGYFSVCSYMNLPYSEVTNVSTVLQMQEVMYMAPGNSGSCSVYWHSTKFTNIEWHQK